MVSPGDLTQILAEALKRHIIEAQKTSKHGKVRAISRVNEHEDSNWFSVQIGSDTDPHGQVLLVEVRDITIRD
jgi:hypothetical protein